VGEVLLRGSDECFVGQGGQEDARPEVDEFDSPGHELHVSSGDLPTAFFIFDSECVIDMSLDSRRARHIKFELAKNLFTSLGMSSS
jgi:hypothetical protein